MTPRSMDATNLDQVARMEQWLSLHPWSRRMMEEELELGALGLVMADEGEGHVRGFLLARLLGDAWHLFNLVVEPSRRRQGLGRRLLGELTAQADRDGYPVLLEVRRSNDGAQRLYQELGFRLLAVRKGYYPDPEPAEDALVMIRDGHPPV